MSDAIEIRVPELGDFSDVDVIEVSVKPGDVVGADDILLVLESDKATLDIPSDVAGTVEAIHVNVGDQVNTGDLVATLLVTDATATTEPPAPKPSPKTTETPAADPPAPASATSAAPSGGVDVVVLGSGPGGYTAAFRAADLGLRVTLVERYAALGGVCLNVGCIPSKALLHTAEVLNEAEAMAAHGIEFGTPTINLEKLGAFRDSVVERLAQGLAGLARQRNVTVVNGTGTFVNEHTLAVDGPDGTQQITFAHAIIAAGSQAVDIPSFPNDDPRLLDSTDALELREIPKKLLVIGGGIIGLEMATVYHALGARVTVVELLPNLMNGCDPDLVRPLEKRIRAQYENIWVDTKVVDIKAQKNGLKVSFEGKDAPNSAIFDQVLVAVGRRPNGHAIGAEHAGVAVDERGFIAVDHQQRTNVSHIFAIGDIVGQPMLAHKATHEGKVAAGVIAGEKSAFEPLTIPSVAYTDPEVAWAGLTETQAKAEGIKFEKATFPWAASGRSLGMGRSEGLTKLLFDPESKRLIGAGVVGPRAGDLISEAMVAMEMGADPVDLGLTIHPHPTLSETINFAAEVAHGTVTDLYIPKKKMA
ncbi:MAG: dihydrolipoyl dehydrogenase [Pseudomonadota bacterium]